MEIDRDLRTGLVSKNKPKSNLVQIWCFSRYART
jgi:hypothetical protein